MGRSRSLSDWCGSRCGGRDRSRSLSDRCGGRSRDRSRSLSDRSRSLSDRSRSLSDRCRSLSDRCRSLSDRCRSLSLYLLRPATALRGCFRRSRRHHLESVLLLFDRSLCGLLDRSLGVGKQLEQLLKLCF
jgi:hypothetical protein